MTYVDTKTPRTLFWSSGRSTVDLEKLMAHARMMSDGELAKDFKDCVLPLAASQQDRIMLESYFGARKDAPYWSPGGHSNNDKNVGEGRSAGWLAQARRRVRELEKNVQS